MLNNIVRNSFS